MKTYINKIPELFQIKNIIFYFLYFLFSCENIEIAPRKAKVQDLEGFVRIEGGVFTMGSPKYELGRYEKFDVEGQKRIKLTDFYIAKYEVTQSEYKAVMGYYDSSIYGDDLPADRINWYDAIEYCNNLSELQGLLPVYTISKEIIDIENVVEADKYRYLVTVNKAANGYRLPTSAEWECACRAGTTTLFNTGNTITPNQANYNGDLGPISVGSYKPNSWGIYDMHGNVWEWCWDWYIHGFGRIIRGGAWYSPASELRSASVVCGFPHIKGDSMGFRLARNAYSNKE